MVLRSREIRAIDGFRDLLNNLNGIDDRDELTGYLRTMTDNSNHASRYTEVIAILNDNINRINRFLDHDDWDIGDLSYIIGNVDRDNRPGVMRSLLRNSRALIGLSDVLDSDDLSDILDGIIGDDERSLIIDAIADSADAFRTLLTGDNRLSINNIVTIIQNGADGSYLASLQAILARPNRVSNIIEAGLGSDHVASILRNAQEGVATAIRDLGNNQDTIHNLVRERRIGRNRDSILDDFELADILENNVPDLAVVLDGLGNRIHAMSQLRDRGGMSAEDLREEIQEVIEEEGDDLEADDIRGRIGSLARRNSMSARSDRSNSMSSR